MESKRHERGTARHAESEKGKKLRDLKTNR